MSRMRGILAGLALLAALTVTPAPCPGGSNCLSPAPPADCVGPGCYLASEPNGGRGRAITPSFCPNGGCASFEPTGGRRANAGSLT